MKRIYYFDYLRVLGAFAVIMIHMCALGFRSTFATNEWIIFNFLDSCSRWAVPIFVMISGALFLDQKKTIDIRRLYNKNIRRIITAFLFWSTFYAFFIAFFIEKKAIPQNIIGRIILGDRHMWFLLMIIGLYIFTPVIKPFVRMKSNCVYFLSFALMTTFIVPMFFDALYFWLPSQENVIKVLSSSYEKLGVSFALGYTGYFVLGHYLNSFSTLGSGGGKKLFMILFILMIIIMFLLTVWISHKKGTPDIYFYGNLRLLVLVASASLFMIVKSVCNEKRPSKIILSISSNSFGIYLVHFFFIRLLEQSGMYPYNNAILIPFFALGVLFLSWVTTACISKIPLSKYIL